MPRLPGEPGVLRARLDRQVLLRAVRFTALPKRVRKHGLRPVIRHVMHTAAYLVRSARRLYVRFPKTNFRLDWLYEAMASLEPLRPADRAGGLTDPVGSTPPRRRRARPRAGKRRWEARRQTCPQPFPPPRWRRRGAGSVFR